MINGLFGGTMPLLEKTLDLTELNHKLISSNIANEETPGYKARSIDFESELKRQMNGTSMSLARTDKGHLPLSNGSLSTEAVIKLKQGSAEGLDGNSVTLEEEMVKMSENSLKHEIALTFMNKKLKGLKEAINSRS